MVCGTSEVWTTYLSTLPLLGGTGFGDILGLHRRGGAEGRIIQCFEEVLCGAVARRPRNVFAPILGRNGTSLVGIRRYQAGVNCKAFTGHRALIKPALNCRPEDMALSRTFSTASRVLRMFMHLVLRAKPTKQAVRQVEMNLPAMVASGADAHHISAQCRSFLKSERPEWCRCKQVIVETIGPHRHSVECHFIRAFFALALPTLGC